MQLKSIIPPQDAPLHVSSTGAAYQSTRWATDGLAGVRRGPPLDYPVRECTRYHSIDTGSITDARNARHTYNTPI